MSLKILLIVFPLFSICWPSKFLKRINHLSCYNPKLVLKSIFSKLPWIKNATSSQIWAQSKLRMVHHPRFLLISFCKFIYKKQWDAAFVDVFLQGNTISQSQDIVSILYNIRKDKKMKNKNNIKKSEVEVLRNILGPWTKRKL